MKQTTWQGCLFEPGSYVFINDDGNCDIYQRTASFMQKKYKKLEEIESTPSDVVKQQYAEIIGSKDSL